jgi:hypothetical protein
MEKEREREKEGEREREREREKEGEREREREREIEAHIARSKGSALLNSSISVVGKQLMLLTINCNSREYKKNRRRYRI